MILLVIGSIWFQLLSTKFWSPRVSLFDLFMLHFSHRWNVHIESNYSSRIWTIWLIFLFVSRRSLEDLCVVFRDWVSDISSSSCRECLLISGACSDCLANVACVCVCFFVVLLLLGFFSKMFLRFLWQQSMQFIVAEQILFLFINLFVISRISVSFSTSLCLYTYISSVPPQVFF